MEHLLPQLISYSEPVVVGMFALSLLAMFLAAIEPTYVTNALAYLFPDRPEKDDENGADGNEANDNTKGKEEGP
jgi:hypothetical protein